MAKQAKMKQTDYNIAGKNISDTASPLYQENLQRLGQYLNDPTSYIDKYLNQYYGANAVQNQDFLRRYNRAMNQRTGANYAATGGGYTSSGQRAYDDQQRYYNDLLSRLQQYGVSSARGMYDQDVANTRGANADYNAAYQLGKPYSDVDQYNYIVDQANNNWWSDAMSAGGKVLSAIPTPVTMALGAGLQGAGAMTSIDTSNALNAALGNKNYNYNPNVNTYSNLVNSLNQYDWSNLFKNKNTNASSNSNSALSGALSSATSSGYNIPNKIF